MTATFCVFLDERRLKSKSGCYPIKLRVTYSRKSRIYSTILELPRESYLKLSLPRQNEQIRAIKNTLNEIEVEAGSVISRLQKFSFEQFENTFVNYSKWFVQRKRNTGNIHESEFKYDRKTYEHRFPIFKQDSITRGSLLEASLKYIDRLLQQHRISTAASYQTSYSSFYKFRGEILLKEIDADFLVEYEAWMLAEGYSKTTIGINTRQLRTLFNEAIAEGLLNRERNYPFGRRKYQPPISRNIKKALSVDDLKRLYFYQPQNKQEQWAKDFWIFSYLGNGINPKDIALLKVGNIKSGYIEFERAKTLNTSRSNPRVISFYLTDDLVKIIDRWANKSNNNADFLFPILTHGLTPIRQYELIQLFVRSINDWIAKIGKNLGIDKPLSTYVARHSFSTMMKKSGVNLSYIQEALGHHSSRTTEYYLDSFENETKKEYANFLTKFELAR